MRFRLRHLLTVAAVLVLVAIASSPSAAADTGHHPVDINSASAAELAKLPGIGEAKAKAIVEYRSSDPFKSVDDLKKVKGIGDKMLDALRPEITVGPEVGAR